MKNLTLLRHAKSSWSDASLADFDRPLNRRGERNAPDMGDRIAAAGIRPSMIISSPAARAITTARIVARQIGYPAEFLQRDERLYLATLATLLDFVGEQESKVNNLMLVGHNPGLTEFANYLVPGLTDNVPTCGVVSVNVDADDWNLGAARGIELEIYDYPKRLP